MAIPIPVQIAVEDPLSEAVLRAILDQSGRPFAIGMAIGFEGYGYIKSRIRSLNRAARGSPFLVLTDLDRAECPARLIADWLPDVRHPNLIFRVAVREVEAWLLAHRREIARHLGVSAELIPGNVDEIADPKAFLINLARRSRNTAVRAALVPRTGSTARVGPEYNAELRAFVENHWDAKTAVECSPSLHRAVSRLATFQPVW